MENTYEGQYEPAVFEAFVLDRQTNPDVPAPDVEYTFTDTGIQLEVSSPQTQIEHLNLHTGAISSFTSDIPNPFVALSDGLHVLCLQQAIIDPNFNGEPLFIIIDKNPLRTSQELFNTCVCPETIALPSIGLSPFGVSAPTLFGSMAWTNSGCNQAKYQIKVRGTINLALQPSSPLNGTPFEANFQVGHNRNRDSVYLVNPEFNCYVGAKVNYASPTISIIDNDLNHSFFTMDITSNLLLGTTTGFNITLKNLMNASVQVGNCNCQVGPSTRMGGDESLPEVEALQLQASPNPFANQLELTYQLPEGVAVEALEVRDVLGKLIFSHPNPSQLPSGWQSQSISTDEWSPGMYFLSLRSSQGDLTKRLLKTTSN
ncbi:MAG: T9SS type A sorting domain-containing protein [Bacteroidota bacterium]